MNIGNKIKKLRLSREETQKQLGELLGIESKTVSKWERAQSNPNHEQLKLIAKHYETEIGYFYDEKNIKNDKYKALITLLNSLIDNNIVKSKEDLNKEVMEMIKNAIIIDLNVK